MFLCMGEFKNFCMGKWIKISDVISLNIFICKCYKIYILRIKLNFEYKYVCKYVVSCKIL